MDRVKDKLMPRAQRKVARATFEHWLTYFQMGWAWWAQFAWSMSSMAISLGVPIYILLLQRGMFYDWWVGNHRPDVAIIKPRTRR